MKSTFFSRPLEFSIETVGEKWRQGDKLQGCIKLRNHLSDSVTLSKLDIQLEIGHFKKIKIRDEKSFEMISILQLAEKFSILPNQENEFAFNFKLPANCQITDKDRSLFLTLKLNEEIYPVGHLELVVIPKLLFLQFIEVLETFYRFKVAQMKYIKGNIEFKLAPPKSRDLSHVDSFVLKMKEEESTLKLEYLFSLNSFVMEGSVMSVQKKTKEFKQSLHLKQCYTYGESLNHDFIKSSIDSILSEVLLKKI